MPFIERQRQRIFYQEIGSGPAVVLGHSLLCSGKMWEGQIPRLADSYRVVNVDYRGHGKSEPVKRNFTLSDLVDDTVAILDELGMERAVWGGLSTGGMVSLRAALQAPERVRAVIVSDASAEAEPLYSKLKYRALGVGARLMGLRRFVPALLPIMFGRSTLRENRGLVDDWIPELLSIDIPSTLRFLEAVIRRDSLLHRLGQIRVPALVMVGEEDRAQPVARSRRIADGVRDARLEIIPRAGHLCALEQPEVVTRAMIGFLDSLAPPA
jgi:pimeloyl-ACP methyl ester carboxylesterase